MFFLAFASSIRVFTLFLNLLDSEIIVIPFIVLCAVIFCFIKINKQQNTQDSSSQAPQNDDSLSFGHGMKGSGRILGEKQNQKDSSAKASEGQIIKPLLKYLLIGLLGNVLAIGVIFFHLNLKDSDYSKQFIGIKNTEYTTPERKIFNDFVRISDTQKYHKYYVETQDGKTYLLNSEKDYHIGDILYLSATEKDLDFSNIFSSSGNTIFSNEFWNYEFNYDKRLFMKGVDGSMYEKSSFKADCEIKDGIEDCSKFTMEGKSPHFEPLKRIDKIRARMQNTVISIFGENKYSGLLLGLFIGDKSMIPSDNYDTFVNSGLVHIIAVSGGNIAMVLILLSFLLSFLPFYVRNGFLIVGIIFYALICGSDASVFRAAVMGSLTLIALFRGREISIRRSMMYAFMAILIFNPFSLGYDIGFILSFGAITGIVLFQKFSQDLSEKRKEKNQLAKKSPPLVRGKERSDRGIKSFFDCKFWKEYLVPTIGASLGTAPILIFFMNGVNLVGILLNIIIVPIIPIVTIYGFISLVLSLIVQRSIRIRPEKLLMDIIYGLSEIGAKYAIFLQSGELWKKYVLVVLFIGLGIFAYLRIYRRKDKAKTTPQPLAAPLTGSKITSLSGEGDCEAVERLNKKNQIFDEIMDETQ